jgi:RimJ/RimL family protein N-acetyltransferase
MHAVSFLEAIKASPNLLKYVAFPVMNTKEDFMREFYDQCIGSSPGECLYAIFDKTNTSGNENTDANYAGIASLSAANPVNATADMGIIIFPDFQQTHVATNAISLLLLWTLDPPAAGGLGLRRVEWKTHAENAASRKVALRMGFEFEGIARWQTVFPGGKVVLPVEALEKRNGTKRELPGRHTAIYSIVWDEWDDKRPRVVALMERKR